MCGPYTLAAVVGLIAGGGVLLFTGDRLFAIVLGLAIAACLVAYGVWDQRSRQGGR